MGEVAFAPIPQFDPGSERIEAQMISQADKAVGLDMENPLAPKSYSKAPLFNIGELGAFDDCGVMPHSVLKIRNQYVMYYTGWSKSVTVALLTVSPNKFNFA